MLDIETIVKGCNYLDLSITVNGRKRLLRPSIIQRFLNKEELSDHQKGQIALLSKTKLKKLTKTGLKKAAKEFDERERLEQDVKDAKRKLAEDKLADLGLTKEDLKELLR